MRGTLLLCLLRFLKLLQEMARTAVGLRTTPLPMPEVPHELEVQQVNCADERSDRLSFTEDQEPIVGLGDTINDGCKAAGHLGLVDVDRSGDGHGWDATASG